jgi:hypothetical protein
MQSERTPKRHFVLSKGRKTWSRKAKNKMAWCVRTRRSNKLNFCRWWPWLFPHWKMFKLNIIYCKVLHYVMYNLIYICSNHFDCVLYKVRFCESVLAMHKKIKVILLNLA